MDAAIQELNEKIDLLTRQVSYLNDQAQLVERQREERAELVRDITPLANQAFSLAVEQLEEVQGYIDLGDLLSLFKRLLRNGRNLEKMLDQLESTADLIETISPLADDAFGKVVDLMADLEARGYFTFARGSRNIMDKMVAAFNADELEQLGESIAPAMSMVKQLAQPEMLSFASETIAEAKDEVSKPVDASYLGLLRQMHDPAVRRGIALTLRLMHIIGTRASSGPVAESK